MSKGICRIADCETQARTRGWCNKHYQAFWKYGDPLANKTKVKPDADRFCLVDGCERHAYVPGSGRGWCVKHYQRWQRWGDPLGSAPRQNLAACSVDGCDTPSLHRNWCQKHYTRWLEYGNVHHRSPGEVIDGKRVCPRCKVDKQLSDYSPGATGGCKRCYADARNEWRAAHPELIPKVLKHESACENCGVVFMASKRQWRHCSDECAAARKNINNWPHLNARRARIRETFVEKFDRHEVFERDDWTCGLCGTSIDPDLIWPDLASASLDHIVPVSLGGTHERANAQASHLFCNVSKGNRVA